MVEGFESRPNRDQIMAERLGLESRMRSDLDRRRRTDGPKSGTQRAAE